MSSPSAAGIHDHVNKDLGPKAKAKDLVQWCPRSQTHIKPNELCGSRHNVPRPSPPSVGAESPRAAKPTAPGPNVAVDSHVEYVPTVTAAAA